MNLSSIISGNGGFVINGIDSSDGSGVSVSGAGDVNGDGLADVIVGARFADPDGNANAGESYVIFSPVIPSDLDGDGAVGDNDLMQLLKSWGSCPNPCIPFCPGDIDHDCTIGITDLLALLGNWMP